MNFKGVFWIGETCDFSTNYNNIFYVLFANDMSVLNKYVMDIGYRKLRLAPPARK